MILFPMCYVEPSIPGTLDFIGFSDGLEDQKSYVFSPSVLPKIQGMILCPFFSCFQRRFLEVSKGDFWTFPKETSGCFQNRTIEFTRSNTQPSRQNSRPPALQARHPFDHPAEPGCSAISRPLSTDWRYLQ